MSVLLLECKSTVNLAPISDTRMSWDITVGAFTNFQRLSRSYINLFLHSFRIKDIRPLLMEKEQPVYEGQDIKLLINSQYIPARNVEAEMETLHVDEKGNLCYLHSDKIDQKIIDKFVSGDQQALSKIYTVKKINTGWYIRDLSDIIRLNGEVIKADLRYFSADDEYVSPSPDVWLHKTARVDQYVSFNSEDGPVIVDSHCHIRPFSIIDGPCYLGHGSLLDSAKVRRDTTVRDHCRIGGEVEASIIESYSNKHHEGFLGHSYLGSWVNIGALATTSDLKNNYGKIRLQRGRKKIQTDSIKLGSFIADYAKVGIGMMLNTGTIISTGANIFQDKRDYGKYIAPFQWGNRQVYELKRFMNDLQVIMARRDHVPGQALIAFLEKYYKKTVKSGG